MRLKSQLPTLLWRYGLVVFLFAFLIYKAIAYCSFGDRPTPAVPPAESVIHHHYIRLSWSPGDASPPFRIQVAQNGDFSDPVLDRQVYKATAKLPPLEPGTRYCWRVFDDDQSARASCFKTADLILRY
ncbi:MAG: fibronectin type III domain-containing protein [Myxococcota bacterium]|nr:fibronectin type III domain-containing protein [Myxococcota bacterium]